jgi:uncharacterized protein involved in outer membrane biogenesis
VPHISFSQIRIEEPSFTAAPKVAFIDTMVVEIDLKALIMGKLDFPTIDISHPVFDLLRNPDGTANWDIAQEAKVPSERGSMPIIGKLTIKNGKLTYRDVARKVTIDGTINTVAATGGTGEGAFKVDGNGTYRDAPFTIKLSGGSLNDLRETTKPYEVDATASVGNTKISIVGTVTDPFKLTDMNLKVTAQGDNAQDLYPIFGIPAPPTPPYKLAGRLDRDGKAWLFKDFTGTVGKSDLEGSLRFETKEQRRIFVSGNLQSKNLDFADVGLLVGAPGSTDSGRPVSDAQKSIAKHLESTGRVLPDAPLNLDEVRNVDADITFKGVKIEAQKLPLENVDFHMTLDHALLKLEPLKVGVAGGQINSNIIIDARTDTVATDYDIRFSQFKIDQFFQKAGHDNTANGSLDGRIRLHGTGNSVRASLGSANGEASAIVDNGQVSDLIAQALGLDVARALGVLIGGDKLVPLHCMVADFEVTDGIMRPKTLVIDTDAALTTGEGTISLKDEHLDLKIHGAPKNATPIGLGGPILVGGSFRDPSIGLGAAAYLKGGAAVALGALLTPVASILGFIDVGDTKAADCANLEQQAGTNATKVPTGTKHLPPTPPKKSASNR